MKSWNWATKCLGLAAMIALTSSVWGQAQGLGGATGGGTGAAATGAATGATGAATGAAAPASSGGTIWNFFGINKAGLRECKVKLCKSPIGMLLGNTLKPVSAISGGLIPPCCPKVLNEDALKKAAMPGAPKGDAQAAAATIAQSEAEAKERRAAVRYLGTVDCHYWGDVAEPALIKALRKDPNECVRWEAAMALGNGCCCTMKTIEALTVSVYGVDKDGITIAGNIRDPYDLNAPVETSERVKGAALAALQHCLSCYSTTAIGPEKPPEKPDKPPEKSDKSVTQAPGVFHTTGFNKAAPAHTMAQVIENARQMTMTPTTVGVPVGSPASSHTLSGVFSNSIGPLQRQNEPPADVPLMSAPPPRYSGLIPWLTR